MTGIFQAGKHRLPFGTHTYVMGILNVTPDSFSDGGKWLEPEKAVAHALEMEEQGAEILDVGAQSTRPGFEPVAWEVEWDRLAPVLEALRGRLRIPLSVDTFYPQVAVKAAALGADIINDIRGLDMPGMAEAIAGTGCGCVIMHHDPGYPHGVAADIRAFFEERIRLAEEAGIGKERICLDPGIGFGKEFEENLEALRDLKKMEVPGCAMLVGASRKRFIGRICGQEIPSERLSGTLAAHTLAIAGGAHIIRVHDVPESVRAARVADAILYGAAKEE